MTDRQRWYVGLAKRKPLAKDQEIICCPRCKGEGKIVRNARTRKRYEFNRENYKRWYEENKQRLKEQRLRKQLN